MRIISFTGFGLFLGLILTLGALIYDEHRRREV